MRIAPADALSDWVRSFRLHDVRRVTCGDGRAGWVKRRRRGVDGVIAAGSALMKLSNGGIRMFGSVGRWQAWEVAAFRLVHAGEAYRCGRAGPRGIWMHDLPGQSLRDHAAAGTLSAAMMRAAGAELRRAHGLRCAVTKSAWSHGDHPAAKALAAENEKDNPGAFVASPSMPSGAVSVSAPAYRTPLSRLVNEVATIRELVHR